MTILRSSLSAFALLGAVLGASTAAHATPVTTTAPGQSFNDVGIGSLSNIAFGETIDNQTAVLNVTLKQTAPGLVTTDSTVETQTAFKNGNIVTYPFSITQHGKKTGTAENNGYFSYFAGFTFNNGIPGFSTGMPNYVQYVPSSAGEHWIWVKGVPTVSNTGVVSYGPQVGAADATHLAGLTPNTKYTLLFSGIVDLALNGTTSFGGTISAVPLPGSLVMFGSALLGLTAFGARRRSTITA